MHVAPEYWKPAFTCPHCFVLTTMEWEDLDVDGMSTPVSRASCFHCNKRSYWFEKSMFHPASVTAPMPSDDLPESLKADFLEARLIVNSSPRGAAALLRLVIQKLMPELGETGGDINTDIKSLVAKRKVSERIQKALDSVRVIGNEAVHPGTLDVGDNQELANSLFYLVNLIVYEAVTVDKSVNAVYDGLPINKIEAIKRRDGAS